MARYLYRCSDGAPYGYIDEEGGTDAMLYTLDGRDRKSTRLNSSHVATSYAVFCLKKKK